MASADLFFSGIVSHSLHSEEFPDSGEGFGAVFASFFPLIHVAFGGFRPPYPFDVSKQFFSFLLL